MAQLFAPRKYQELIIAFICRLPRCAVYAAMGLGKTSSVLFALTKLYKEGQEVYPALVLAPRRVAASTWPDEVAKWSQLADLCITPVLGTAKQRLAALEVPSEIYTMNYENLPWLVEHFGDEWPFVTVVADESTLLKSFRLRQGGQRAAALGKVAHNKVRRFIELTGTPVPNGIKDLWGQIWFIDRGQRLGKSFAAFTARWFRVTFGGFDYEPYPHAQREIEALISDITLVLKAEDWFDIEEPIIHSIKVEMSPASKKIYEQLEKQMFTELASGAILEATSAAARTLKCLQMANGAVYTDDSGRWEAIHDAKLEALKDVIEEANGAPVLVAYYFRSDIERLQKAFPKARVLDKNPKTIDDWNAGKIDMLFAHPASAGHGLNLAEGGNILVFFGHTWNLEHYMQIMERIGPVRQAQLGLKRAVFVYKIITEGTLDSVVIRSNETKRAVQDILLEELKRRGYAT